MILKFLKKLLYNLSFSKKVSSRRKKKSRELKAFSDAKTVGVLFEGTNVTDVKVVKEYVKSLKSMGKTVETLGYLDTKEKNETYNYFSNDDLNWYYIPKSNQIDSFIKKEFDVLIDLHTESKEPLGYIASLSNAHFKVGKRDDQFDCYDLAIDCPKAKIGNVKNLISQIDHYIKIINN